MRRKISIPKLYSNVDWEQMNKWVDSVYTALSDDEKIGQLFMPVAVPTTDAQNMRMMEGYVKNMKVGGMLFRSGDPVVQADITNRLQKMSSVPLLISLDGEWGLAMRLSGTTRFPKNMMLGAVENVSLIEEYAKEVGRQCLEMGIHINFAPVLDVNSNSSNPVIGIRSFGEDPNVVAERGLLYAKGLESMGIISVAKHFPGHGNTSDDSHVTLPIVNRTLTSLDSIELYPFKQYISQGFSGIMTGHIYVPVLDDIMRPASMSEKVVTNLLKESFYFEGLYFTDALEMRGAATSDIRNSPVVAALLAGNDVALSPGNPEKEFEAVKTAVKAGVLKMKDIEAKCRKVLKYKYIAGLNRYRPIELKGLMERLNTPHAAWLTAKLNEEAITVLKNDYDFVPLKQLDKKKIAILTIGDPFGDEFQQMLNKYDSLPRYQIVKDTKEPVLQQLAKELDQYDALICAIYTVNIPEPPFLQEFAAKKDLIYAFFTSPYFCADYKTSIYRAKTVIMAYEGTPLAQQFAAQTIYGGIAAKGKLTVSIPGMYFAGTGYFTPKTRLGYHQPEEVGVDATLLQAIDTIVNEGLREQAFPGCQVLVAKDGMVIFSKSYGYQDFQQKRKITDAAVYDLASVTKTTAILLSVMKAYDNQLITISAPISQYLTALQGTNKSDLRVEELLYHESGLPPVINFYLNAIDSSSFKGALWNAKTSTMYPVQYDRDMYVRTDFKLRSDRVSNQSKPGFTTEVARNFFVSDSFKDVYMKDIKAAKLTARGKYVYSDINFILLKMMVEQQMQRPMDQLLNEMFFSRLGARRTTFNPLQKIDSMDIAPTEDDRFLRRQLLRGHVHDEAAAFQGGVSGNAGLFSNANDLAKVLQLYVNHGSYGGETYLSDATTRLFTESKSATTRRGLGFDKPDTTNVDNSPCGELAPGSVYGHTGYTGTCFWIDPDNNLTYIFLSNRVNPTRLNNKLSSLNIRTRIQDAIYRSIGK
ncbi:MAG: serine hydrolase [Tannerella sp.]|nr:serine hydrolase [Tannerella sp.]